MKEIIVIENDVNVSIMQKSMYAEQCMILVPTNQYKIEKQPETWEELKELCKDCAIIEDKSIEIQGSLIGSNIVFLQDGTIFVNTDCCFKEKATPQQMWNIIKSLVEK